jgi:hypothetical protein
VESNDVSIAQLWAMIGEKEVGLAVLRGKLTQAVEAIKLLQARIAELEAQLADPARSVPTVR